MKLKRLAIEEVPSYKENAGQYEGKAEFYNEKGAIQLQLSPGQCNKIFMVCAEAIESVAKEAAQNLTCTVIEQQKLLTTEQGT